ncbi:MAG: TonB-dependent receptor [Bacteroidota bacterium]|jgi:outer membrane receptor protein involved in Fe transport
MKRVFLSLLFLFSVLSAQDRGTLSGTVTDAKTKESIPGVIVKIKGTYYGINTDFEGKYTIPGITPGEYTVEVSILGYAKAQYTGITIRANETTTLDPKLNESVVTLDQEVVIIGEKPLFDIEQSSTAHTVSSDEIRNAPVLGVQDVVSKQVGVTQTSEGIYIRGSRSYETDYYVDGVSAKDPLAGTGFGVDVSALSMQELEITTGGIGAEYGATGGVVSVVTQSGDDTFRSSLSYKRDNFGFNKNSNSNFNTDIFEANLSGPIVPGKFFFFSSFTGYVSDEFTRHPANQLSSSIFGGSSYAPRNDNRWNGTLKLTYKPSATKKIEASYNRSVKINQNTRMLQIGGNDVVLGPGYQYEFSLQPDNANTYTHDGILTTLKFTNTLSPNAYYEFQVGRLFTRLRADANGRPWRPDSITENLNPESIFTYPISYWGYSDFDSLIYVIQGDPHTAGLYNNGGIATLWHDHYAEEYTVRYDFNYNPNQEHKFKFGFESKFQEYQWIDINKPWVGAPIKAGDPSRTLGESFDIWHVYPAQGSFYASDQITFKGLIATLGLRFQYWFPGKFVDDIVGSQAALNAKIITADTKENYLNGTYSFFGSRWKGRILPRIRVSFPVSDNQVMYFNYGHSVDWPNAYQVYSGLDISRPDRSPLSRIGNPALDPETTVEYEIGLRNQFTTDDVFTLSAYSKDKYDYVVRRFLPELDKTTYVNEDYARINGLEVSYIKRVGKIFRGTVSGSYQVAKGKSNSAEASFFTFTDEQTTKEKFLAWDRPFQFRVNTNFLFDDETDPPFGISALNNLNIYFQWNFQSGKRYTPYVMTGIDANTQRPVYRQDLNREYQLLGESWWWGDLNIRRWFTIGTTRLTLFVEITNIFDNKNATIINPLTGKAYELGDPTPFRDPTYPHPEDSGIPPFDPARYLEQRHITAGLSVTL